MGIYFNDKLLSPKKDGTEIERLYYKGMQRINAMFEEKNGTIVIVRDVEKQMDTKGQSSRPVPPYALPTEIPMYLEESGAVSIKYSPNPPQRRGKEIIYSTTKNFMEEFMVLQSKDRDKAWFIIEATNFIQGGDPGTKKIMRIFDPQKSVLDEASEVKEIAKVDALLVSDDSSIMNIDNMRIIADKFGIDIKEYKAPAAAFVIRQAVIEGDKKNNPGLNIKKFLKMAVTLPKNKKDVEPEEGSDDDVMLFYTIIELEAMVPVELKKISKAYQKQYVPQCTKVVQIEQILEAQEERKILEGN